MPYVALPVVSKATRLATAEARWAAMQVAKANLGVAIALQRRLIGLVLDLTDRFEDGRVPKLSLPPRYLTTKLTSGIPALVGEPIWPPASTIRPTLLEIVHALAEGGGGESAVSVRQAIDAERIDLEALLILAIRRDQGAIRANAAKAGLNGDLLWLIADLTVAPFAHGLLDRLFGAMPLDSRLRAALDAWTHGYCPLCGSWPVLLETLGTNHRVRCSFCAAAWDRTDRGCLYCGETGEGFQTIAPDPMEPGRVIETCGTCRGYTKVIPADTSLPFPLVALADLESMDLDIAALQRGCARPAFKQFVRR
jgi:FdhE protein